MAPVNNTFGAGIQRKHYLGKGEHAMNFGEKLKDLRTQKGWSQEELAKQMGVTRRTIGGYEAGTTYPRTRDMYAKLAELLETDVNYLMTENEEFMTDVGALYGRRGQAQASEILSQTRELFAGGSLSEEDQKAFAIEMQRIFMDSKKVAREKFTPKKYRKNNEGNGT